MLPEEIYILCQTIVSGAVQDKEGKLSSTLLQKDLCLPAGILNIHTPSFIFQYA